MDDARQPENLTKMIHGFFPKNLPVSTVLFGFDFFMGANPHENRSEIVPKKGLKVRRDLRGTNFLAALHGL